VEQIQQLLSFISILTDKMSLSKPVKKQAKTEETPVLSPLRRCGSLDLVKVAVEEKEVAKDHPTPSPSTSIPSPITIQTGATTQEMMPRHPNGHKVRDLAEIWKSMDSQDFLRLTDTLTLNDVWIQPLSVVSSKGAYATVAIKQIIAAPHIKYRDTTCKLAVDDLIYMLFLSDNMFAHMCQKPETLDQWMKDKSALYVHAKGLEMASDRANFCQYLLTEEKSFTLYPEIFNSRCGVFFRKICYHSYKVGDDSTSSDKIENISMIKCHSTKGSFEYIIEARIFPFPKEWFIQNHIDEA